MNKVFLFLIFYYITSGVQSQTNTNLSNWALPDGEQYLAVNPANQNNIIIAWMQLKTNLKMAIAVRASTDGGNTWSLTNVLPNLYPTWGAADPSIAFSRTGTAYLCYVDYKGEGTTDSGSIVMRKSTNGGLNWSSPVIVRNVNESSDLAVDRPWITVDNTLGIYDGYIYVTSMPPKWAAPSNQFLHMKYSTNGGANWSGDIIVSAPGFIGAHGSSGVMTVTRSGVLCIAYASLNLLSPSIALARTTNNGVNFTRTHITSWNPLGDTLYQPSYNITSDPDNGQNLNLCIVSKNYSDPDIFSLKSTNGGSSWSGFFRVNKDSVNNGKGQDMCWSDWRGGRLGIAYRDRRNYTIGSQSSFDIYYSLSTDGGNYFYKEEKINLSGSVWNQYGYQGNDFLGFALSANTVNVTWAAFVSGINWDVFYGKNVISGIVPAGNEIPQEYKLYQNYPNPFNPVTEIKYSLPENAFVKLTVYDLLGKEVKSLKSEIQPAGVHSVFWNASSNPSGIYFYRLEANDYSKSGKMILIK